MIRPDHGAPAKKGCQVLGKFGHQSKTEADKEGWAIPEDKAKAEEAKAKLKEAEAQNAVKKKEPK